MQTHPHDLRNNFPVFKLMLKTHFVQKKTYLFRLFSDGKTLSCVGAPAVLGAVAAGVVTQLGRPHTRPLAALHGVETELLLLIAPVKLRVPAGALLVLTLLRPALLVTLVPRLNAGPVTILPVAILT